MIGELPPAERGVEEGLDSDLFVEEGLDSDLFVIG